MVLSELKVLHVLPSLSAHWGGPVTVIANLVPALHELGVESSVFAASGGRVGTSAIPIAKAKRKRSKRAKEKLLHFKWVRAKKKALRRPVRSQPDEE